MNDETEYSRRQVLQFCDHLSNRDFSGMLALATDDATWWVVGRPDRVEYGGTHRMTAIVARLDAFLSTMDSFAFTVSATTAEKSRVAVEATSEGRLGGSRYRNDYLMQYELEDGKIASVREFLDPFEVEHFLESLAAPPA